MRKPFIAGNWKMNSTRQEALSLVEAIAAGYDGDAVDLAVCPPFVYLDAVTRALESSPVAVGAQNMYYGPAGALTGETSAAMLLDVGCTYVILGHSERRHVMGETDELINKKVKAAIAAGLKPILCIGEQLDQREAGRTLAVAERQVREGLAGVSAAEMAGVTLSYEPVWAIGTGRTATPEQAQEVHAAVRAVLAKLFKPDVAEAARIQYGGSVKPENAKAILAQPDVDGGLIGGASLKADSFLAIAQAAM